MQLAPRQSRNLAPLTLQALRDEIAKNKALLDTLEDTGKEIIEDSSEDPQVVRDVRGELNKIVSPVDAILRKLAERQVKLQNALLRSQEFQVKTDARLILMLHAFLYQKLHPIVQFKMGVISYY